MVEEVVETDSEDVCTSTGAETGSLKGGATGTGDVVEGEEVEAGSEDVESSNDAETGSWKGGATGTGEAVEEAVETGSGTGLKDSRSSDEVEVVGEMVVEEMLDDVTTSGVLEVVVAAGGLTVTVCVTGSSMPMTEIVFETSLVTVSAGAVTVVATSGLAMVRVTGSGVFTTV